MGVSQVSKGQDQEAPWTILIECPVACVEADFWRKQNSVQNVQNAVDNSTPMITYGWLLVEKTHGGVLRPMFGFVQAKNLTSSVARAQRP